MKISEFIIMPSSIDTLGLVHKPGRGPNNRFDFKNKANNKANEVGETKEAPAGTYFTKTGNLVKGRLTKAAKEKGARETDPKDNQRSKVPPVSQYNKEEAAGVGIVTKQNATKDVPVGGEYMNVKKLGLGKGKPKTIGEEWQEFQENFADKKVKGKSRPGRVKRAGASCKGSVTSLRAKAKKYGGEKGKMYHWCANMKSGRKKK